MMINPANSEGINHIGVVGAGAWGTALAQTVANAGRKVTLWTRGATLAGRIELTRENAAYLPGVTLSDRIRVTHNAAGLARADAILLVCPAQHLRSVLQLLPLWPPVLICAKGIERSSGKLVTEVFRDIVPTSVFGMLSGPSFATEVARGLPCAVTVAFDDLEFAERIAAALGTSSFRPYVSNDATGVAVGGAVKNVLAIACGIVEGRGYGESARAALTARGFAEMMRFGMALGARAETLTGLSGLGDLILTASSKQSRNFALGVRLAEGGLIDDTGPLAEGAASAEALVRRGQSMSVDMPISEAVAQIVSSRTGVDEAIRALLSRPFRNEF